MSDPKLNRLTHEEVLERLPAFVVGALDPEELLAIEEYIRAHPDLMARVNEFEMAAAQLAYAAPWQPLSKEVHSKVMSRASASLPARPQTSAAARADQPIARRSAPDHGNWLTAWWRRRGLFDLSLAGAVAAALILGVVYRGALWEVQDLRRQVQELGQQVATIQSQNNELEIENVQLQTDLETRQNQLASIAGAQQTVALGGTESAPGASGTLYVHDNIGTLVLSNLSQLNDDQIYQLWLIPQDGAPIPAGLLGNPGEAAATVTLTLPTSLERIAAVGVSVEPPGGSDAPTGPIVLLGEKV